MNHSGFSSKSWIFLFWCLYCPWALGHQHQVQAYSFTPTM